MLPNPNMIKSLILSLLLLFLEFFRNFIKLFCSFYRLLIRSEKLIPRREMLLFLMFLRFYEKLLNENLIGLSYSDDNSHPITLDKYPLFLFREKIERVHFLPVLLLISNSCLLYRLIVHILRIIQNLLILFKELPELLHYTFIIWLLTLVIII